MTDASQDQPLGEDGASRAPTPPRKAGTMPSAIPAGDPIPDPPPLRQVARKSRSATAWVTLIVSAVILALLLVFLLQNANRVGIHFFGWFGTIPLGVATMFAAIAGAVIVAVPAGVRIAHVRRRDRR